MISAIWFVPPPMALLAASKAAGPDIETQQTRSSDEQFDALVDGSRDVAVTAMDNVMAWNLRPGPRDFVIIGQAESTTPLPVIARRGIGSIAALADATLLVDSPSNGFVVALRVMLADEGVDADRYKMLEVGGVRERFDALVAGKGDATLLGPPFDAMAIAQGFVSLGRINDRYPGFPGQGIVTRRATLATKGEDIAAWFAAMDAARADISADPASARAALSDAGFPGVAADGLIATNPASLVPDRAGIALLISQRRHLGLPGAGTDYETLVDGSALAAHIA